MADKKTVYNTECIKCGQCISCCPVSGALSDCSPQPVSVKNDGNLRGSADNYNNEKAGNHSDLKRITKQGYHFKESVYPALILIIFFIPVIYGKYFSGFYHNEKMTTLHAAENLTEKSGLKAAADSIDIKSSFTIEQLSGHLDISPADLKKYLGMEENAPDDIKLRDIEDFEPELTFKVIKEKISEYIEKI